jgi:hypothetical protein
MHRRRTRFSLELFNPQLEPRALLSHPGSDIAAEVGAHQAGVPDVFHKNGINGLLLHRSFVNRLNDRLNNSKDEATRVTQAFQAFATGFNALPVVPAPGATGPTLNSLVATLQQEVTVALTRREGLSSQGTVSEQKSIKFAPLAPIALVPFAQGQISTMAKSLAQLPPITRAGGQMTQGNPLPAINNAVDAILNAVAETSIHPLLFNKPSDFYLNPNITFTTTFSGAPASSSAGFFIRGPHGTILPGATLHPFAPN